MPRAFSYLRMSTDLQLKGDSRRRQLEKSRKYAEQHGLDLADEDQLEDIGVSAFKGANVTEGALGRFIEAAGTPAVPAGSYLLVESLDRITRQKVDRGLALFLRIIDAGINVVTLMDGHVYKAGETKLTDLIISLVVMSTAHEESAKKAERVGAAWQNKRKNAAEKHPMTKWAPAWLRLSEDRTRYEVIPERAAVVRSIFEDAAAGIGIYRTTVRLNESGTPTFTPSNGWHQSYVSKILSYRSVLGEFQPCKRVDGRHIPDGDAIENYFPPIVDTELFFRAQNGKAQRRASGSGRKGPGFTNLFSGLATCAYCGSPMKFENKGPGAKGGTYLICDNAKRRLGCYATRWKYKDFEASFLAFVRELDVDSILNVEDDAAERKALDDERATLQGEFDSAELAREKTFEALAQGGPVDFLNRKMNQITERLEKLEVAIKANESAREKAGAKRTRITESKEEIHYRVGRLQSDPSDEIYRIRAQISSRLSNLVSTIQVAPLGDRPRVLGSIEKLRSLAGGEADDVIALQQRMIDRPESEYRYFVVGFEDHQFRVVYPKSTSPLEFHRQMEADTNGVTLHGEGWLREVRYISDREWRAELHFEVGTPKASVEPTYKPPLISL